MVATGTLKKETEKFILAAEDQTIRTNTLKTTTEKLSNDSKYILCREGRDSKSFTQLMKEIT